MGGRGTQGARNNASTAEQRTILESEVKESTLYKTLMEKGVEGVIASNFTRAVMKNPDFGSTRQENYDFYELTGRQFNSQMQNMKKELEKQGYEVTIKNVDRKSGGEYRLKRGYGFQRTSVKHYTVREISWRKR